MADGAFSPKRLRRAAVCSWKGLRATFLGEAAFRLEIAIGCVLAPLVFVFDLSGAERAVLFLSMFVVLAVELLNTGLETILDRVAPEEHPLAGKAKDIGSAAVMTAMAGLVVTWLLVLTG